MGAVISNLMMGYALEIGMLGGPAVIVRITQNSPTPKGPGQ